MKKYIGIIGLLLIVILSACEPKEEVFTDELKANINKRIENKIITGIVIGVITPEGTSYYSQGVKSLETKEPIDEHTVFEIGSITKTFTGILLANEVIKGELSLDDSLQEFLPEGISAPTRKGESIKLVHLANHSSALPRIPTNLVPNENANRYGNYTRDQLYELIDSYEISRDIGVKFEYSNFAMGLLGTIIADKNNTDYEELMLRTIAEPLEMENTRITLTPEMEMNFAMGHNNNKEVETWLWDSPILVGCGAIHSTAEDMLKYLAANMGMTKSELSPAIELSHKYSGISEGDINMGLGWITQTLEGMDIIWHDGGTNGQMSFAGFTKDGKRGVVVLTNSTGFPDDIGFHILNPESPLANPKPSIATKLSSIIEKEGLNEAIKTYKNINENHADDYDFREGEFIRLGYRFIKEGKAQEAVAILKLCVDRYSESWNAYDSYADALKENNEIDKAVENYKKSLKLNVENKNAIENLKKLGVNID